MEVVAVSAMVSMTLKAVGNKLAPLLISEYSSIVSVKRDLQELRDQVEEINGWLETRHQAMWNDPSFNWLKRLEDVAYAVDDVVDELQLEAEKHDTGVHGGTLVTKYVWAKPKSFILKCKAASKIRTIKNRLAAIVKQRSDFSIIANSLPVDHPIRHMNATTFEMPSLPIVDAATILGRNRDKDKIITELAKTNVHQEIEIISVIGLGGSGKTTMAKLIFSDGETIKKHFELTLWVHVSQDFNVVKLIEKLFEAVIEEKSDKYPLQHICDKISNTLNGKRFLLVLDDVWTEDQIQWEEFMVHLKSGAPESKILVTSRSRMVAEAIKSTYIFDLPLLSLDDSWQLFKHSFGAGVEGLDSEFQEVGKEIVKKCGGVPLAIKVLAGALHGMEQIEEWQAMRDKNLSNVNGREGRVLACLRLSYSHFPSSLKQCFTVCSVFPKGYKIDKEQLIDLWIAHDMTTVEDGVDYLDLEYVGHKHFDFLVQVSFLQNVEEEDGRVKCEMHDLVHDLALNILGFEISLVMPMKATNSTKRYKYISCIEEAKNVVPAKVFEKTRALYITSCHNNIYGLALKRAIHLRSITVEFLGTSAISNNIFQVKYLKYLSISRLCCEKLPEAISDVWSLQALHVTHSFYLLELPESIGRLKKLRTLNLSRCQCLKSLPESIGNCPMISSICLNACMDLTMLPDSIGKLQKLRALNLSRCLSLKCLPDSIGDCQMITSINLCSCSALTVLPNSIGKIVKLRVLRLPYTTIEQLPSSIAVLRNLECLDLHSCQLRELPEGICNLDKLQVLNLKDCQKLRGMPAGIGRLSQLNKLGLFVIGQGEQFAGISELVNVSRIGEELIIRGISHGMDPYDAHMACLKQKANLHRLSLQWMLHYLGEVNTELEKNVLDGLEPPHGIKELEICGYSGRQCALWMQNQVGGRLEGLAHFPFLRVMTLSCFLNLKHLNGIVELPCLEELVLAEMPLMESISGGPFPSLMKLVMLELPSLGDIWLVAEGTISDCEDVGSCSNFPPHLRQFRVGNCISDFTISDCPRLKVKPYLPSSLQHWRLSGSSEHLLQSLYVQRKESSWCSSFSNLKNLELRKMAGLGYGRGWDVLQHMTSLESMEIDHSDKLTELPENMRSLTSLRSLKVSGCSGILMLPEWLGELRSLQMLRIQGCNSLRSLPRSIGHLTSLQELHIISCLPPSLCGLGELRSLRRLAICGLAGMTCLPQSLCSLSFLKELHVACCVDINSLQGINGLTSLENLHIHGCLEIKSLPEGIKELTALKRLSIFGCSDLVRRCEKGKGEDWHFISHIPNVWIR